MTDREPAAPANQPPLPGQPRAALPTGGPSPNAHPEPAPRGDTQPMALTIAPRPPFRPPADGPPTDPLRVWLAQLPDAADALPPFTPSPLAHRDPTPAEADAVSPAAGCPPLFVVPAPHPPAPQRGVPRAVRPSARPPPLPS